MKKKLLMFLGALFCVGAIAYCTPPYSMNVEVFISDGEGNPVEGVEIRYVGDVSDDQSVLTGNTDSHGRYKCSTEVIRHFYYSIEKDGFYNRKLDPINYFNEAAAQNIQKGTPITVKRELVMRKILNPVDLVKRYDPLLIKAVDEKLGFDLDKMDWVAPYGEGKKSDFYVEQNGYWKDNSGYDVKLTISFPNKGDGIFAFNPDKDEFRFAPETGYQSSNEWKIKRVRENLGTSKEVRTDINEFIDEKNNYFLRVRTVLDKDEKVISANYACIKRDLIESYLVSSGKGRYLYGQLGVNFFFNPEVNNRSLEQKISK